jgi:hypothetical protein
MYVRPFCVGEREVSSAPWPIGKAATRTATPSGGDKLAKSSRLLGSRFARIRPIYVIPTKSYRSAHTFHIVVQTGKDPVPVKPEYGKGAVNGMP